MLSQSAGVVGGGNPRVFGSTLGENAVFVDGIDSTDPVTATYGINLNFDTIQEINLETAGFEARYGRATGAVVNVITKSGGNEFSGTADARYRDSGFNTNGEHFDKNESKVELTQTAVTLGGPIERDKLWFFTALTPIISSKSTPTESETTYGFEGRSLMGKLTWQVSDDWQVTGRYVDEDSEIDFANASRYVAPEAASFQDQPSSLASMQALGLLSGNLEWSITAGLIRNQLDTYPRSGDFETIGHIDSFGDFTSSVNYTNQQFSNRDRDELGTSLAWFTGGAAGDHELRLGIETASTFFRIANNNTGNGYILENSFGRPYALSYSPVDPPTESDGDLLSTYLQDTWRVSDNLTLKFGLRHDQIAFENDVGAEVANMSKLQPRVGFAWDVQGDAKTIVRGSWGRFMHPNALTLPDSARINQTPTIWYFSCSTFQLGPLCESYYSGQLMIGDLTVPTWTRDAQGFDPNGWAFWYSLSDEPGRIAENIRPTYADERIIGIERELTRRTSIGLTYIDKETSDILEDTCNGNLPTPSADADCSFYVVANLPGLKRDYSGFVLDFESRFTDWMHVRASYTRSTSEGNVEYTQSAGADYDIYPDHFENRYGLLSDHRRHRLKVNGYVDLPLDFTLGFSAYWSSPSVYTSFEPAGSYGVFFLEPRGSREANDNYGLDLQAARGFDLGNRMRLELIAAIYNVLDDEQVFGVCAIAAGCPGDVDLGGPTSYQQPRRYEAGIRFEF